MDLDSLKYADLQRLAKEVGLKANMKADKLLKALKEHFTQQQTSENGNDAAAADAHAGVPLEHAQVEHAATFVTERRGRGRTTKRKHSDPAPVTTAPTEEVPLQKEESRRGSKRRKVSSAKDTETPVVSETANKEDAQENGLDSGETNPESVSKDAPVEKNTSRRTAGKIPRHEGLMKKKPALRPTTPNFKKLHEAHFNKMESIDSYVQRKNKQMEVLRNSVKELQTLSEKTLKSSGAKTRTKPPVSRASLFSPGEQGKKPTPEKRRHTRVSACKPALKDSTTFRPTVLTTNKINVRFSQATQDNEHKRSLVKTPARMSPFIPLTSTPGRKSDVPTKPELNKSIGPVNKTPGVIPYVFSGNNSMSVTPGTNKKNAFDLKASLSRPLTYKPHKGKLKPFGAPQENTALNKSQTIPSHQKNYKQHQAQTREERRAKHTEDRKQKKEKMLGARRGLVMA